MDVYQGVMLIREGIRDILPKYKRLDDLIIVNQKQWDKLKESVPLPVINCEDNPNCIEEDELASVVCQTIQKPLCKRLAIDKGVNDDDFRTPSIEMILGDDGIVEHKENQLIYKFDITKCMFSFGNIGEKMRMAELDCSNEILVDLFAGIGYFTLPLLIHAKAKHLYACEWNPDAIDALKENLKLNKVTAERYTVIEGDNRTNRPVDVAQRVILGILPSCSDWMSTAIDCVDKRTGAILHCHELIEIPRSSTETDSSTDSNSSILFVNQTPNKNGGDSSSSSDSSGDSTSNNYTLSTSLNNSNTTTSSINQSFYKDEALEKGNLFIEKMHDILVSHNLDAKLLDVFIVKSYSPRTIHVVYDIEVQQK